MWEPRALLRMRTAEPTLESTAARAGCAMACPFSSSDEFEAAVISSRRRAGAFWPVRLRRYAVCSAVLAVAALATASTYLLN